MEREQVYDHRALVAGRCERGWGHRWPRLHHLEWTKIHLVCRCLGSRTGGLCDVSFMLCSLLPVHATHMQTAFVVLWFCLPALPKRLRLT